MKRNSAKRVLIFSVFVSILAQMGSASAANSITIVGTPSPTCDMQASVTIHVVGSYSYSAKVDCGADVYKIEIDETVVRNGVTVGTASDYCFNCDELELYSGLISCGGSCAGPWSNTSRQAIKFYSSTLTAVSSEPTSCSFSGGVMVCTLQDLKP